jgi:cell division protein FtsI/penicillin-binding protein 2
MGGRKGAVVVVALPSGALFHTQSPALARKKFTGSSIFKPLAAYLFLKERAVRPDQIYRSRKLVPVERYGVTLSAPYDAEDKDIDLAHALSESNNGYFYIFGQRLEMDAWLGAYREMGLGPCVRAPITQREKAEFPAHGGPCVRTSTLDLVPYLKHLALDASPEMATVRDAMRLAVEEGTGKPAAVAGVAVCGKTGWLNGAGRFLGFAPQAKPRVGVIVTLPGATGGDAAEVAGKILKAGLGVGSGP